MKAEYAIEEMKQLLKKVEKDNKLKTLIFAGIGIAIIVLAIVIIVIKLKSKTNEFMYDDWSELDDMDYDDYDLDDYDDYDMEDFDDSYSGEEGENK